MAWWGRFEAGGNLSHDQRGSIKLHPVSALGGKKWANLSAGQGWHRRPKKGTGTCRRVIVINETDGAGVGEGASVWMLYGLRPCLQAAKSCYLPSRGRTSVKSISISDLPRCCRTGSVPILCLFIDGDHLATERSRACATCKKPDISPQPGPPRRQDTTDVRVQGTSPSSPGK